MHGIRRALFVSAALALLPSLAAAGDPYTDYRIPEHYWRSWRANLTAGGDHQVVDNEFTEHAKSGTLSGSGATSLSGGFDSDPRSSAYGLSLQVGGNRAHQVQHDSGELPSFEGTDRDRRAQESVTAFFAFSRYPWSAPLGFTLSSTQVATFSQSWVSGSRTFTNPPLENQFASNATTGGYNAFVSLGASASWGRVRDATPVYQVEVLEERLLADSTILRPLSPAARERLASLYTMEARLAFAHQRPTKYFWGELERLLREDGALAEAGLDAYSVQRLLEPLTITGTAVARTRGFSVGPQVFVATLRDHVSTKSVASSALYQDGVLVTSSETAQPRSESNHRDDFVLSGVAAEYHRPFGPRWQVDGLTRGLLTESGETLLLSTLAQAVWLVADRWYADATFDHELTAPGSGWDRRAERWHVTCGASLSYFLEDAWALQLGASQVQDHGPGAYLRHETFSLGVSYQFAGFLNAPGLFAAMRLAPPAH